MQSVNPTVKTEATTKLAQPIRLVLPHMPRLPSIEHRYASRLVNFFMPVVDIHRIILCSVAGQGSRGQARNAFPAQYNQGCTIRFLKRKRLRFVDKPHRPNS